MWHAVCLSVHARGWVRYMNGRGGGGLQVTWHQQGLGPLQAGLPHTNERANSQVPDCPGPSGGGRSYTCNKKLLLELVGLCSCSCACIKVLCPSPHGPWCWARRVQVV